MVLWAGLATIATPEAAAAQPAVCVAVASLKLRCRNCLKLPHAMLEHMYSTYAENGGAYVCCANFVSVSWACLQLRCGNSAMLLHACGLRVLMQWLLGTLTFPS
jgi:hypothetical protein